MRVINALVIAICVSATIWPFSAVFSCDLSKEPWLSSVCEMPDKTIPDHACRISAYLKSQKIAPDSIPPKEIWELNNDKTIEWESYESLAWSTCEKVKKFRCSQVTNKLMNNFQTIQEVYITNEKRSNVALVVDVEANPQSERDGNLIRNYELLDANARLILAALNEVSKTMPSVVTTINSDATLLDANRSLVKKMTVINTQLVNFNIGHRIFNSLVDSFSKQLATTSASSIGASSDFDCQGYESTIEVYNTQQKKMIDMVNDMTFDRFAFAKQVNNVYSETYYKWKYEFYKQYASAMKKDINTVLNNFRTDIELEKILWNVADWWVSATINGLAGRLHNKYYYYSEPLRLLRVEKVKALNFKKQLTSLNTLPKSTFDEAQKSINDKIAEIDQAINWIESKGWQGLLNLQTLSAKKRAELLPSNMKCQSKTQDFLNAAVQVNSIASFDAASPLYKETVDVCIR